MSAPTRRLYSRVYAHVSSAFSLWTPQSIHQSLAGLSKVIRGSQLLTPEVQMLASFLLNQEVIQTAQDWCRTLTTPLTLTHP